MLFQYGKLYFTKAINNRMGGDEYFANFVLKSFQKHISGDWGDLDKEDKQANFQSLKDGSRLLSAYIYEGEKIWIITEATDENGNRSATTILYAAEY